MAKRLHETLRTIENYKRMNPHYEELLDILGEILILRERFQKDMKDNIFPVDESLISKKMAGGLPLIDFTNNHFDLSEPERYFKALMEIAEERVPDETGEILKKIKEGTISYEQMIYDAFHNQRTDVDLDEDDDSDTLDLIDLFLEESLRPALGKVVEMYGEAITAAEWCEGYCPICGQEPKIGEIKDEDGFRFLFCNQCGYEWHFRRIKCPFCGNEEQQSLAYFTIEGEERYRVDVCYVCKRYIKMVDFRDAEEEANLDVEDIATLHLDILANEEGYD
jgi:FdhE protein